MIAERENFHSKRSIEGKIVSEIVNDRVASIGELNAWSRSNDSTSAYAFPPPSLHRKFRGAKFCDSASFLINLNRKIAILLSDWNGFFMGKRVELRSVQAFSLFATASNRWFVVYARNFRLRNLVRDGCQQCSNIRWSPLRKPGDIAFLIDGGGQLAGHYEIQSLVRRKCWPPLGPSSFPRV